MLRTEAVVLAAVALAPAAVVAAPFLAPAAVVAVPFLAHQAVVPALIQALRVAQVAATLHPQGVPLAAQAAVTRRPRAVRVAAILHPQEVPQAAPAATRRLQAAPLGVMLLLQAVPQIVTPTWVVVAMLPAVRVRVPR